MTKLKRTGDGGYLIKGKKYETLRGTRRQVYEYETAYKTAGGLLKEDLVQNDKGRIVSKAKFDDGPNLLKNLTKRGFFTKKGKFGHTKMKTRKLRKKLTRKNRRKMKGGSDIDEARDKIQEVKKHIESISKDKILDNIPEQIPEDMITPLLEPFEPLFEAKDKLNKKLDELEEALDAGEEKLNEKVKEITDLIDEELEEKKIDELMKKIKSPSLALTPQIEAAKIAFKPIIKEFMKPIREEIKKKIEEISKSPISTAAEVAKSVQEKEPAEDAEEKDKEPSEEKLENAVKKAEAKLDEQTQEEIKDQVAAFEAELVGQHSGPDEAANLTAKKFETISEEIGGKKKSKGKK